MDKEKIYKGLERCSKTDMCCMEISCYHPTYLECPYHETEDCVPNLVKDSLVLLKEQDEEIENLKQTCQSMMEGAYLLKEQEAKTGHWIYKKYDDMFMCSCCKKYSIRNDYPYCHWCGAKMEGR